MAFKLFFRILFCILSFLPAFSYSKIITNAPVQKKSDGYFLFTVQPAISCNAWNENNVLISVPCFRQFTFNPYFEYGMLPWLTFSISAFFQTWSESGVKRDFNIQHITPALQFLLLEKGRHSLSLQISYNQNLQSQYFNSESNLIPYITPYEFFILRTASLASTTTRADLEKYLDIRIMYGIGSSGEFVVNPKQYNAWYTDYQLAYRQYFDGAADEIHFDWGFGLRTVHQRLILDFQSFNTFGLRNPRSALYPNYDIFTLRFDVMYDFSFYVRGQIGIEQDVYGRNSGMGIAPFAAIMLRF